MYKYGRGMWKNIESGNELSWVIGNGIGGYANHTVAGGGAQAFSWIFNCILKCTSK